VYGRLPAAGAARRKRAALPAKQDRFLACFLKHARVLLGMRSILSQGRRADVAKKADEPSPAPAEQTLGQYLRNLRLARQLTLREAEEASGVSNPYLSQLETDKIAKPSPHVLHKLAPVYGASYEALMEKAGYLSRPGPGAAKLGKRAGRLPAFSTEGLSPEEEEALLEYLAFLRSRKSKK
jgi:transcriptional regulator with XRE-family HTH domain